MTKKTKTKMEKHRMLDTAIPTPHFSQPAVSGPVWLSSALCKWLACSLRLQRHNLDRLWFEATEKQREWPVYSQERERKGKRERDEGSQEKKKKDTRLEQEVEFCVEKCQLLTNELLPSRKTMTALGKRHAQRGKRKVQL